MESRHHQHEVTMTEKNYAQSIAGDLFHMIKSAQEQGVGVDTGFRNQAMSSPSMSLTYMFLTKNDLLKVPALPAQVKKQVRRSNAMAVIELANAKGVKQTAGIHLIWSSAKACSCLFWPFWLYPSIMATGSLSPEQTRGRGRRG